MKRTISKMFFSIGVAALLITSAPLVQSAKASEPFIAQITMFGGNFAPRGWALCDGQLLAISQNSALFSVLGTTYGGDGRTTFGLPDLRGRVAMHAGTGPGLTSRRLGQKSGQEQVTLSIQQIPAHKHVLLGSDTLGNSADPTGRVSARKNRTNIYTDAAPNVSMNTSAITSQGGGQSHSVVQPFQVVNYIIALQGIFPSRN